MTEVNRVLLEKGGMRMGRRKIVRTALAGLGALALLARATPSPAYEEDTHFLMTFVACRAAGLTQDEALLVAAVDQGMDDSPGVIANGGLGGAIPNEPEESLWHALDRRGTMGAEGVVRASNTSGTWLTRKTTRDKLIRLGVFFHFQQDTWAHRWHYTGVPPATETALAATYAPNHLSRDAYTTYNTPVGHARHVHQPDRPPFDPVAAYLCLEETLTHAREFVDKGLMRQPSPVFKDFRPFITPARQDDNWDDRRKGIFCHMLRQYRQRARHVLPSPGLIRARPTRTRLPSTRTPPSSLATPRTRRPSRRCGQAPGGGLPGPVAEGENFFPSPRSRTR